MQIKKTRITTRIAQKSLKILDSRLGVVSIENEIYLSRSEVLQVLLEIFMEIPQNLLLQRNIQNAHDLKLTIIDSIRELP